MNSKKGHQKYSNNNKGSYQKPDSSRFEMYSVLPDETGFKILGSDHIFYFDVYGGWFDEYGNYYDADAIPRTPPNYSDEEDDYVDDVEKLVDEYEDGDSEEFEDQVLEDFDKIYTNTENKKVIETDIPEKEIEFEVKNINYKATEDDFEKFLEKNDLKWIDFEFEYDNRDRFTGFAFIRFEKSEAQKFIALNGKDFQGRSLRIFALKPELLKEKDEIVDDDEESEDEGEHEGEHEEEHEEEHYEGEGEGEGGENEEKKEEEHKTNDAN